MGTLAGSFKNINGENIAVTIDAKHDIAIAESFAELEDNQAANFLISREVYSSNTSETMPYWDNSTNMFVIKNIGSAIPADNYYIVLGTNLIDEHSNPLWLHANKSYLSIICWLFSSNGNLVDIFGKSTNGVVYWQPTLNTISTTSTDYCFLSRDETPLPFGSFTDDDWAAYKEVFIFRGANSTEPYYLASTSPNGNWYDIIFTTARTPEYATDLNSGYSQRSTIWAGNTSSTLYWHFKNYNMNLKDSNFPVIGLPPGITSFSISTSQLSANSSYQTAQNFLANEVNNPNSARVGWLSKDFTNSVKFSGDPITIEENCSTTFDPVIKTTATVRLTTTKYLGDELWTGDFTSKAKIVGPRNINGSRVSNFTLFRGWVQPNVYSQPFANFVEEIEISLVDYLARLDDMKYNGVTPDTFDEMLASTGNITFRQLLIKMLEANGLSTSNFKIYATPCFAYDNDGLQYDAFECAISENYLYGEDFDDTMTYGDILKHMMQYLNMHIKQLGDAWYIFRWQAIKPSNEYYTAASGDQTITLQSGVTTSVTAGTGFQFYDVLSQSNATNYTIPRNYITASKSAANDANITLDEVYNQISLKCDLESVDTIIESPLDKDAISSVYTSKQLYCREYRLDHKNDWTSMITLVNNQEVAGKNYTLTDWYVQVMYSKYWNFKWHGVDYVRKFLFDSNGVAYNQLDLLRQANLSSNTMCPMLLNVTKVENPTESKDDGASYSVTRSTCLYIPINGGVTMSEQPTVGDSNYTNKTPTDTDFTNLVNSGAMIEYTSPRSGSILSPTDDETTNYLVFTGKLTLLPTERTTPSTTTLWGHTWQVNGDYQDFGIFKLGNSAGYYSLGGDSIYTRRYFNYYPAGTKSYPNDNVDWAVSSAPDIGYRSIMLKDMHASINEKDYKAEYYEYKGSLKSKREFDELDSIKKIPILECELIVGNKRLIEKDIDEQGNSTFEWVEVGNEPVVYDYDDDTLTTKSAYPITTFSLGINPKIEDKILGTEYDLQNTVEFTMNLEDVKGTAIPIKKSDGLAGEVKFKILGPINLTYQAYIYRHATWFRKRKYAPNSISLLKQVRSICISDFECKIVTDNAGYDSVVKEDKDLIYMSAESDVSINVKDDIEFKFVTQPTSAECRAKKLKNTILQNSVILDTKPVSTITAQATAKPEELYIDAYYSEYSVPKLILEQTIKGTSFVEWSAFKFTMLDKVFYILNKTEDVLNDTYTLKMKEI